MDTSKRLTLVSLNFHPEPTGIAPYATALAKSLAEQYSLHVITGVPHYPSWKRQSYDDSELRKKINSMRRLAHVVPKSNGVFGRLALEFSFAAKAAVANWRSPDLVLLVTPSILTAAIGLLRAKIFHKEARVAIWVQDLYGHGAREIFREKRGVQKFISWIEKKTLANANAVIVIHDSFKQILCSELGVPEGQIEVIQNWSQFVFNPTMTKTETANEFGLKIMPTVLHAGNIGRKQALEYAILAAQKSSVFQLIIVGDGAMKASLEELAKDTRNVRFLPPVTELELSNLLDFSDILLVNESSESGKMAVPSKLTTYMSAGKPIIAATSLESNCSEEILKSGAGIIVEPGNPDLLSSSIEVLLRDLPLQKALAAHGKNYSNSAYSAECNLNKFGQLIKNILR